MNTRKKQHSVGSGQKKHTRRKKRIRARGRKLLVQISSSTSESIHTM